MEGVEPVEGDLVLVVNDGEQGEDEEKGYRVQEDADVLDYGDLPGVGVVGVNQLPNGLGV